MGADTEADAGASATDSEAPRADVPDVTVVIPVYNTMPYLTACMDSLVGQSIGQDRLQIVAVDDGSTDGSGEELDRYAAQHPELVTVVHQENSGGPAAPCNRGLELARGRYVFFIGADDYLAERALEKLVAAADEWGSDVIWGRIEGVGGRRGQMRFRTTEPDLPFPHSLLPFSLGNAKMFRRSVVEEHQIRYALDLRVGSDQPFTIAAMLHARRISVLADETYYYGVKREDSSNITFSSGWKARLEDIGTVMRHIAELVPPGEDRDQILQRHFTWELNNRIRLDMPYLGEQEQGELCALVAKLADEYLTDGVSRRLPVGARLRVRLAQSGQLDALRRVLEFGRDERHPPLALVGRDRSTEAVCLAYPGFGELPQEWFVSTKGSLRERFRAAVQVTGARWEGATLEVTAGTELHPVSEQRMRIELEPVPEGSNPAPFRKVGPDEERAHSWPVTLTGDPHASGSRLTARIDVPEGRWALRFRLDAGDRVLDLPGRGVAGSTAQVRRGTSYLRGEVEVGAKGRLLVTRSHLPLRSVLRDRLLRR